LFPKTIARAGDQNDFVGKIKHAELLVSGGLKRPATAIVDWADPQFKDKCSVIECSLGIDPGFARIFLEIPCSSAFASQSISLAI
jgi:hypothetical protein